VRWTTTVGRAAGSGEKRDHVAVLAGRRGPAASQGEERRGADEEVEPIIVEPDAQPVADQA
jgi:hypothetical protein